MSRVRSLAPKGCCAVLALLLLANPGCSGFGPRPAWELPPPPPKEAPIVQPGALHRFELPNGLRGLLLEDHRLPSVTLGIALRRGAGSEASAEAGIASFTANLMARGAGERDALTLAAAVEDLGASMGVSASWDAMTVRTSGLSRDLDTLFEVLADVTLRPRLEESEAQKARAEILASLEQMQDDPQRLIGRYAASAVFGEHRYGTPRSGTAATVAEFSANAARAFHTRNFTARNAIFFVSGDVDRADVERRVTEAFGDWAAGEVPAPVAPSPSPAPRARKIVLVDKPELSQARIVIAHEGLARSDDRRMAAGLMNNVLGGSGFSSRLMKRVRSEEGLTYSVWSGFGLRREPGPFRIETFTRVAEVRRTIDLLLDSLARMHTEPPDESELIKAKSYAVGRFGLSLETSARVLGSIVDLEVHGLPEDSLDTYRSRVRAVTGEEVAGLSRSLLHPDRAAIIVLGPAETLASQLEGLGEVEVLEP